MQRVFKTVSEFLEENEKEKHPLPVCEDLYVLGEAVEVGGRRIANRLVCQAMEGCDGTADGIPGELTLRRYDRLARGGAGLIWYEATAVLPEARANPHQLLMNENNLDAFKRHVERIKETGLRENGYAPTVIMQTTHSGRYSKPNGRPEPLIAYHNPLFEKNAPITDKAILDDAALDRVGEALVAAAERASKAGFDGVDIKCCHRYLNSELLSAYEREGRYGGSFENRTRLLREAVEGARAACPSEFLVTTRLNVYDGFPYPYGFGMAQDGTLNLDPTEPIALIKALYARGVRLVNVTMGNPYVNPHVNRPFAAGEYTPPEEPMEGVHRLLRGTAVIKRAIPEVKLISSGLSFLGAAAPQVAAGMIGKGCFDFAGFGRMIFAYPDFAKDILLGRGLAENKLCTACSRCTELMRAGSTPGCVIRDKEVYLPLYKQFCGRNRT